MDRGKEKYGEIGDNIRMEALKPITVIVKSDQKYKTTYLQKSST